MTRPYWDVLDTMVRNTEYHHRPVDPIHKHHDGYEFCWGVAILTVCMQMMLNPHLTILNLCILALLRGLLHNILLCAHRLLGTVEDTSAATSVATVVQKHKSQMTTKELFNLLDTDQAKIELALRIHQRIEFSGKASDSSRAWLHQYTK